MGLRVYPRVKKKTLLEKTVVPYFISLEEEYYRVGMLKLVKRWDKCLNANGEHVEK
jgi:hypothetical protein